MLAVLHVMYLLLLVPVVNQIKSLMARDRLVSMSMSLNFCASHKRHMFRLLVPIGHDLLIKWKIVFDKLDAPPSSHSSSHPVQSKEKDVPASGVLVSHWHPA